MGPDMIAALAANGSKLIEIAEHHGIAFVCLFLTGLLAIIWRQKAKVDGQLLDAYRERAADAMASERKAGEVIAANTQALQAFAQAIRDMTGHGDEARYSMKHQHHRESEG